MVGEINESDVASSKRMRMKNRRLKCEMTFSEAVCASLDSFL